MFPGWDSIYPVTTTKSKEQSNDSLDRPGCHVARRGLLAAVLAFEAGLLLVGATAHADPQAALGLVQRESRKGR